MATVTEKVKESLLGVEQQPQVSEQNRAEFLKHARRDEETGEHYMTEAEFIEAIAPADEDYVHMSILVHFSNVADIFSSCSIRLNATNTQSSSKSPTARILDGSRCNNGATSKTSSQSPTPSTRLPFASSMCTGPGW
jgi:hypothetical protein